MKYKMCRSKARLDGKVAIVTGGSSGIGFETAKNLAYRGARVILASSNESKLIRARDNITASTGNNNIAYRQLDLASFASVRNFVDKTVQSEERLDILINNAAVFNLPDRLTEDGLNITMQINYFGTFLLTYLLLPMLKASAPSRIINMFAVPMYFGHIDFDHWNDIGRYNYWIVEANAKFALASFAAELDSRLTGSGVTVNNLDPILTKETNITNNYPDSLRPVVEIFMRLVGQPKEEVGEQLAYLAADPKMQNKSGELHAACTKWDSRWLTSDRNLRKKIWDVSKELVKISAEEDWERKM